jgi:hypothetical protein
MTENEEFEVKWDRLAEIKRSHLALEVLIDKWHSGSNAVIFNRCDFCTESIFAHPERTLVGHCKNCLCPPALCAKDGTAGLIATFGSARVICELTAAELDAARTGLIALLTPEDLKKLK